MFKVMVLFAMLSISAQAKNTEVIQTIVDAADKASVPRELLLAICWVESSYRTKLEVKLDGATPSYGICQVKLETAQWLDRYNKHKLSASKERLQVPFVNAFYAAKYLKYQLKRYNNDWKKAIDAYNKGTHQSSTSQYVKRVILAMEHE